MWKCSNVVNVANPVNVVEKINVSILHCREKAASYIAFASIELVCNVQTTFSEIGRFYIPIYHKSLKNTIFVYVDPDKILRCTIKKGLLQLH